MKETTVDAGTKRYMYNKQGLVSVTLDEQGQFYNPNGSGLPGNPSAGNTDAFYRVYKYDDYGRLLNVGRSSAPMYSLNQEFGPLHYKTTFVGVPNQIGVPENYNYSANARYLNYIYSNASSQDWLASFDAWASPIGAGGNPSPQVVKIDELSAFFYPTIAEKEFMYGGTVPQSGLGKIHTTYSYNNDGMKVLKTAFNYDSFDNLAVQTTTFNSTGNVDLTQEVTSVIEYPSYNYRNSLKEQTVDVDGDGIIDYHCFMEYDALNRLKAIHGASGYVSSIAEATLLVSYEYDDANGLIDKKKHYIDDDNGLSVLANEIDYSYDSRDRLTQISAGLPSLATSNMMQYQLFYDDQIPVYQNGTNFETVSNTNNWNGNINGTRMNYGLQTANIAIPVDDFDKPLLYGYTYDKINRLVVADATVGNFLLAGSSTDAERRSIGDVSVRYDRIGNIESLHRTSAGADILNPTPVLPLSEIQHWNYNYYGATNRLTGVTGQSGTASRAYTYDANRNLLTDNSKDIDATEYGRAAYPFEIAQDQTTLSYLYSENDLRIYKKSVLFYELGNEWSSDYYLMDALGKTVAILHKTQSLPNGEWEYFASGAERECRLAHQNQELTFSKDEVSFYLYDHLGNTRVTYTPTGFLEHPENPTVCVNKVNSVMDYFPYGKVLRHYNVTDERYLTTQHERDQETDLDYRGARYYDCEVGRFLSLDPHSEKYASWSGYNYVFDNPVIFIDKDGKDGSPYSQAFIDGAVDAMWSNTLQFGGWRKDAAEAFPNDLESQRDFIQGQIFGDLVSLGIGTVQIETGIGGMISSLEVELASGGTASPVAIPALIASGAIALNGAITATNATKGLIEGNAQLKAVNKKIANKTSGKNGKHANQKAKETAKAKYEAAKKEYEKLNSIPNKTKEIKAKLEKAKTQMNHLKKKADFNGENHNQNAKGN